jgi:hypothetical protein
MSLELYLYDLRAKPSDAIDDFGTLVDVEHDLCALKTIAVPHEHNQQQVIVFLNNSNTLYYFPTYFFDSALEVKPIFFFVLHNSLFFSGRAIEEWFYFRELSFFYSLVSV